MLPNEIHTDGVRIGGESPEAFDYSGALELVEGDGGLLAELVTLFKEESSGIMEQLAAAVTSGDAEGLRKTAHRLKGASANVGGMQIRASAAALEAMGAARNLKGAAGIVGQIDQQLQMFNQKTAFLSEVGGK